MLARATVNAISRRLLSAWYDGVPAPLWARLAEPAYRAVIRLRRLAYARGWRASAHPGRPVVVIGNVAVGGTGKTPLVAWLVRALAGRGMRPAIVSRGYGGAEPRAPHRVTAEDSPDFSGDEPLLLARATGVPVWICRDRLAAARAAVAAGADIIVTDDGLQHYRLQRDFEIAVIDAERGLGNGRCLPAGPLREPAARLDEVDVVVCNGAGEHCPAGGLRMTLAGADAVRLDGAERRALHEFRGAPVHAVAGIGHPERFFRYLEGHSLEVIPSSPRRPRAGARQPARAGRRRMVLMTSKDAMRCLQHPAAAGAWHVPVEACLERDGTALLAALARRLGLREA
jgi:tetraacyldisaccharide 4'-kinase